MKRFLLLFALVSAASAQVLPPPFEATGNETTAGVTGSTFVSPRRLKDFATSQLVKQSQIGVANGVAGLDSTAKVPVAQLPSTAPGTAVWGGISGTLSNQSDLNQKLGSINVTRNVFSLLQEARTRTVRIYYGGTSIENFDTAGVRSWLEALKRQYGDAGESFFNPAQIAGGSTGSNGTGNYQGWLQQYYGGLGFVRMRGANGASPMTFSLPRCTTVVVRYSTETNGMDFTVAVDGGTAQTIHSNGAQSYNNELVISGLALGPHTLVVNPPASGGGYAYWEGYSTHTGETGIGVIDATLGGSSFDNMFAGGYSTPSPYGAAPIQPATQFAGPASYMLAPSTYCKPDIVIFAWCVNDAGNATAMSLNYQPGLDYLVAQTKANGQQLILIVEAGGHYDIPTDSGRTKFLAIHDLMMSYAQQQHVTVIDWDDMLKPSANSTLSDWQTWTTRWYNATLTAISPSPSYSSGDNIHPRWIGYEPLVQKLHELSATPSIGYVGNHEYQMIVDRRVAITPVVGQLAANRLAVGAGMGLFKDITDTLGRPQVVRCIGTSLNGLGYPYNSEPLWISDTMANLDQGGSPLNTQIAASGTSDKYGKYVTLSASGYYSNCPGLQSGNQFTITAIIDPTVPLRMDGNNAGNNHLLVAYCGDVNYGRAAPWGAFSPSTGFQSRPVVVHMTYVAEDSGPYIVLSGKFYGFYITPTTFPVIAPRTVAQVAAAAISPAIVKNYFRTMAIADLLSATAVVGTSGAATAAQGVQMLGLYTGGNANSSVLGKSYYLSPSNVGSGAGNGINWTVPIEFTAKISMINNTTNGIFRCCFKGWYSGIGAPTDRSIGVEIRNTRIWLMVHNGTSIAYVDSTVDVVQYRNYALTVADDGAGNVTLWVNGTQMATSAAGPHTIGNNNDNVLQAESLNGVDAATYYFEIDRYVHVIGG
jgi:hypothetical protein